MFVACCCHALLPAKILNKMPKAAEALWADCVKAITSLVNTPTATPAFSTTADTMQAATEAMNALPPCETGEWEVIMLKHKVRVCVKCNLGGGGGTRVALSTGRALRGTRPASNNIKGPPSSQSCRRGV